MRVNLRKVVKSIVVTAAAVGLVTCFSAVASAAEGENENIFAFDVVKGDDNQTHTVAFSNSFVTNVFRSLANASFTQACEELNINGFIVDGQKDVNKQISDIENLVTQGVDAIVTIPMGDALGDALQEARNQGVYVICACVPISNNPDAYDVYMGTDISLGVEAFSRALFDHMGGEGNIIMLLGTAGEAQVEQGKKVCLDLIENEYPGIKVLDSQYVNSKEDEGKLRMTDMLLAYPGEIDAVWSDGAQATVGAIRAYVELGEPLVPMTGASAYNAMFKLYMEYKDSNPDFWFAISPVSKTTSPADSVRLLYKMWYEGYEPNKEEISPAEVITSDECEDYVLMDAADTMYVDTDLTPENLEAYLETQQ